MTWVVQIVVLLIVYQADQCLGHGRYRGGYGGRSFRGRDRFPETCDGMTCPDGMACQMEEKRFCRRGACMFPYCVKTGPIMVSSVDNSGVCPMSMEDTSTGCSGNTIQACSNDTVCGINQKCCIVGCGLQCVNVTSMVIAQSRLTVASRFRARNFPSRANRTRSFKSTKARDPSYYCPSVPGDAFGGTCSTSQCDSDDDCIGNQRCCVGGCGRRCLNPVSITAEAIRMEKRMRRKLSGGSKAASSSNTTTAAAATEVTSKSGVCPTVAVDVDVTGRTECVEDTDCPGSMKCCAHGRGFACFDPFNIGLPSVLMSSRLTTQRNNGGDKDLLRIRGMCPTSVAGFSCGTSSCSADTNCTANQLCCPLGSCSECTSPLISSTFTNSRPGICPSFSPELANICLESCTMDSDCEIPGMKCCSVGCSRQCVNPLATPTPMIKAGSCPAPTQPEAAAQEGSTVATTTKASPRHRLFGFMVPRRNGLRSRAGNDCFFGRRMRICRSDADCSGANKCCKVECDVYRCTDAV